MASSGNDPRDHSSASQTPAGTYPAVETPRATSGAAAPHETPAERAERLKHEGQSIASEAGQGLRAAGEAARDKAEEYKDAAKSTFASLAGDAKGRARAAIEGRKDASAQDVADIAHALRTSADDLEQRDRTAAASYVRQAAGGLERFADNLQRRDLEDLARQAEEFARRQPGLFVGGAVIAGFALARFLKSSADRRHEAHDEPYRGGATSPGGYDPSGTLGGRGASDSGADWRTGRTPGAGSVGAGSSGPGAPDRHFNPTQEGNLHGNR